MPLYFCVRLPPARNASAFLRTFPSPHARSVPVESGSCLSKHIQRKRKCTIPPTDLLDNKLLDFKRVNGLGCQEQSEILRINLPFLQKSFPKNSKRYKSNALGNSEENPPNINVSLCAAKSVRFTCLLNLYSFSLWKAHDPGQQEQLPPQQLFLAFFSFLIPMTIHVITASNPDPTAIVPILFIKKSIMNV